MMKKYYQQLRACQQIEQMVISMEEQDQEEEVVVALAMGLAAREGRR